MEIIRLDEVPESPTSRTITPTDQFAEMVAGDRSITVRQFFIQESPEHGPESAIGVDCNNLAKLLDYQSGKQVRKLISRCYDEFREDLWDPNKIEGPQIGAPHKIRSEAMYVVGEGIDLLMMKSGKDRAKEYRKKLKYFARQLRLKGMLNPARAQSQIIQQVKEPESTNSITQQLLDVVVEQLRAKQDNSQINELTNEVRQLRASVRHMQGHGESKTVTGLLPGEKKPMAVAALAGWLSKKEKPHATAAIMAALNHGFNPMEGTLRIATFLVETNEHGWHEKESLVFTEKGVRKFLREVNADSRYASNKFTIEPISHYNARFKYSRSAHVRRPSFFRN